MRILSLRRCRDWAAFRSPKAINKNSQRPKGVAIAVLGMSSSAIGIWWYALTRSILEKMVQPAMRSLRDCMLGMGYLSGTVTVFRRR